MCKVSICIPSYNDVKKIERLVESILIQNFSDYEVIITDDSEGDDVGNYIKSIDDSRIFYYKNNRQLGPTDNCNEALKKATGKFIKIMHHDDWFTDRDSLSNYVYLIDNEDNIDFVFSGSRQTSANTQMDRCISDTHVKSMQRDYRTLYVGNWVGAPSATIFKNYKQRFDSELKWLVDVELYMSILKKNGAFKYTKEPWVCIGVDETQLTSSCENNWKLQIFEYGYLFKKYKLYTKVSCIVEYFYRLAFILWKKLRKKK